MTNDLQWPPLNPEYSYAWIQEDERNHYIVGLRARHIETMEWAWFRYSDAIMVCENEEALAEAIEKHMKLPFLEYISEEVTVGQIFYEMANLVGMCFDRPAYKRLYLYGQPLLRGTTHLDQWSTLELHPFRFFKFRPGLEYHFAGQAPWEQE